MHRGDNRITIAHIFIVIVIAALFGVSGVIGTYLDHSPNHDHDHDQEDDGSPAVPDRGAGAPSNSASDRLSFSISTSTSISTSPRTATSTAQQSGSQIPIQPLEQQRQHPLGQTRGEDTVTVLFDEAHRPVYSVDPTTVCGPGGGPFAAGGYAAFAQYLIDNGDYEINVTHQRLTPEILDACDVLVVPCSFAYGDSAADYWDSEINAIEEWVKAGGGLLLIADHSSFATDMDDIAQRFGVRWGHNVVTDPEDYVAGVNYWIIFDCYDNMPLNQLPPDEDECYKITENLTRIEYYCSNAFTQESIESKAVLITDANANIPMEPALLAIPNGNVTGAGRAVFITDSNVFDNVEDCDNDGDKDFWDSDNERLALNIIDWLAPRPYEVSLISGEDDPITGLPIQLIHWIEPGETTQFHIEAWNLGLREDQIEFWLEGIPENWTAYLSADQSPVMESNECYNLILTVTAPSHDVGYDDYAFIRVHARSLNDDNATDYIDTYTFLEINLDFNVNFAVEADVITGMKEKTVDVGEDYVITIGVTNIGNINDTYELELGGVPPGWEFELSETTMSLGASRYGSDSLGLVELVISVPPTAHEGDTADIVIFAVSQTSLEISRYPVEREDTMRLKVSGYRLIDIDCDKPDQNTNPGVTAEFQFSIRNNGNGWDTVDLSFEGSALYRDGADPNNWTCWLTKEQVTVAPGGEQFMTVRVTPPPNALAWSKIIITIQAHPQNGYEIYDSKPITCTVNRVSAIIVSTDSTLAETPPGGRLIYDLTVENAGNGEESILPMVTDMPEGWSTEVFLTPPDPGIGPDQDQDQDQDADTEVKLGTGEALELGARKGQEIWLVITVPSNAMAYQHQIAVNFSADTVYDTIELDAIVSQVYGLEVTCMNASAKTEPGRKLRFTLEIVNTGNGQDVITLKLSEVRSQFGAVQHNWVGYFAKIGTTSNLGLEDLVTMDFSTTVDLSAYYDTKYQQPIDSFVFLAEDMSQAESGLTLLLGYHQHAWLELVIATPYDGQRDQYTCSVIGTSSSALEDSDNSITIELRNSDLVIMNDLETLGQAKSGQLVTIRTQIENRGDIEARDVKVVLIVDGKEVDEDTVDYIEVGSKSIVWFTWKAEPGDHTIEVRADPDGTTAELHEDNNEKSKRIHIEESGLFEPGFESWQVLLALAGVFTALLLLPRRQ